MHVLNANDFGFQDDEAQRRHGHPNKDVMRRCSSAMLLILGNMNLHGEKQGLQALWENRGQANKIQMQDRLQPLGTERGGVRLVVKGLVWQKAQDKSSYFNCLCFTPHSPGRYFTLCVLIAEEVPHSFRESVQEKQLGPFTSQDSDEVSTVLLPTFHPRKQVLF